MKTEDFDDAIKKKINSIHTTYNDNEIDRVHNYVSKNNPVSFSAKYGKTLLVSAASIVVTALIILNIIQLRKNDTLAEKIDKLEKSQENLQNQMPVLRSDSGLANISVKRSGSDNISAEENINAKFENEKAETSNKTTHSNKSIQNENVESKTQKHIAVNKTLNNTNFNNRQSKKLNLTDKEKEEIINNKFTDNKLVKNNIKANDLPENNKETVDIRKDLTIDSTAIANSLKKVDSLVSDSNSVAIEQEKKTQSIDLQKEDKKKKGSPDLQFSIGLSAEKGVRMFGFGIPVQVAFSDNWSIFSGIKSVIINDIKFRDEREFKAREGSEIRTEYKTPMPDTALIFNIERTKKLVQLPLAIAYNVPLKNDFSLILSAGTDINLAAFHSINYEYRNRNNLPAKKEIVNAKRPVPLINNANVSFGVQKRLDNFIFQANPYLMYHFRKAKNITIIPNSALIPGINFRLMYCI